MTGINTTITITMKKILIILPLLSFVMRLLAQNPIVPEGEFLSDPQVRQYETKGAAYVYGSRDDDVLNFCSNSNDVLVSNDMNQWTLYKNILNSKDIKGLHTSLLAPDCIHIADKYYLVYCTFQPGHMEGIAVSDSPTGPFKEYAVLPQCDGIDPSIFQDDDGTVYLYWGQFSLKCAKMKPDMSGIDESTIKEGILTEKEHHFHEGSQAFKRGDTYYLTFADISRKQPTCIGYATSKSPLGPFSYKGIIIDNANSNSVTWNNHGSVVEIDGKWYVFYHRSTNGMKVMRKACVEPITFDENGLIKEVEMTSQGAGNPLDGSKTIAARLACWMKGGTRVTTLPTKHEILSGITDGDSVIWRYVHFDKAPTKLHLTVIPQYGGNVRVYANKKNGNPILLAEQTIETGEKDGRIAHSIEIMLNKEAASLQNGDFAISMSFKGRTGKEVMIIDNFLFE